MPKVSVHVSAVPDDSLDPVEIEIEGTDTKGVPIKPITFRCRQEIKGAVITQLVKVAEKDVGGAGFMLMTDFIDSVLEPDELSRYNEAIHSDEIMVKLEHLAEIGKGLLEVYSGNPTNAPSGSTSGSTPTGPTSMAASLSPRDVMRETYPHADSATPPMP